MVDRVNNTDTLNVNVEMSETLFADDVRSIETVEKRITSGLRDMLGISAKVHLVNPKTIARSEGKAKRVIDNRKCPRIGTPLPWRCGHQRAFFGRYL